MLLTLVQATPAARVIEWPQISHNGSPEKRPRPAPTSDKSKQEDSPYASK